MFLSMKDMLASKIKILYKILNIRQSYLVFKIFIAIMVKRKKLIN